MVLISHPRKQSHFRPQRCALELFGIQLTALAVLLTYHVPRALDWTCVTMVQGCFLLFTECQCLVAGTVSGIGECGQVMGAAFSYDTNRMLLQLMGKCLWTLTPL